MPLVSVVMPVYNREKFLAEAIESILTQTLTDFEFIIVDDGSQDTSPAIIRQYETRDDRVRFLRQENNMGVSFARNRGIQDAVGEYIAFMDSDDVSLPTRLEKQLRFLQEYPEIGAVGVCSKILNHDLSTLISTRGGPRQHAPIVLSTFTGSVSLITGALMIQRRSLLTVGGFTPDMRYGEEADLFVRLLFHTRIRFANLSEILYVQRLHDTNSSSHSEPVAAGQSFAWTRRSMNTLWDEVTDDTLRRFRRLRNRQKLNWPDRRAAKKDLKRLIESLIEHQLVEPSERPLLIADMNRRLEATSPRRWQQFCHWRRKHFPS